MTACLLYPPDQVDFGSHYYGAELTRTVQLFNNGPVEGRYMISYGTPAEIKAKMEEAEGNGAGADADDPYAGFMANARQKVRTGTTGMGIRGCMKDGSVGCWISERLRFAGIY